MNSESRRVPGVMNVAILSPCIGTCRIDDSTGFCLGCFRTREEVAFWRDASPAVRDQVWAMLPARRARCGANLYRLEWAQDDLRAFVARTLQEGRGTWVFGVFGAVAEFGIGGDETANVNLGATYLTATTARGSIRLEISEHVRALQFATEPGSTSAGVIVLALTRTHTVVPRRRGLTALGPDRHAIRSEDREAQLFDLGHGLAPADFCIRTVDVDLIAALNEQQGKGWREVLAALGGQIVQASPTRVVRSAIGRIEVYSRIPPPGGESPPGPHTHFLPAHLADGRETPPGLELPENLLPCAMFYPGPDSHAGSCRSEPDRSSVAPVAP